LIGWPPHVLPVEIGDGPTRDSFETCRVTKLLEEATPEAKTSTCREIPVLIFLVDLPR
jgi:hypothetical protein